jgi:hypothetical protein
MTRFILFALTLFSLGLKAQYEETIISVGDRTLTVDQAFKIAELPEVIDTIPKAYELDYSPLQRQVSVNYEPKPIKAAKLKVQEPLGRLYRGYAKAGIGLYITPLAELRFNSIRNRDWAYGIHARHFSSQGGLDDVGENAYSQNDLSAWARRYIDKHTIEAGFHYDRDVVHYYGFDPGDSGIADDDYRQRFNVLSGYAEYASHYRDSAKVQHTIRLDYRSLGDTYNTKENRFLIDADLAKTVEDYRFALSTSLDLNGLTAQEPGIISGQEPFTTDSSFVNELEYDNSLFKVEPHIHARKGDLTADVGLGIVVEGGDPESSIRVYPRAYLSYSLFDNLFTPYAGLTGDLQRTSYHDLSRVNPFMYHVPDLLNTSKDLELYAGIRGTILDNLSFNAKFSVADFDDRPFFITDTLTTAFDNRFRVIYDDLREISLSGELTYIHDKNSRVTARLELIDYSNENQAEAWNLPGWRFSTDARYDLNDQFVAKLQIFAEGQRKALGRDSDGEYGTQELRGFVDGSIGLEYRYTKRISAFLDINNLTGGRYPRWLGYPVQSILVLGGLTYSF